MGWILTRIKEKNEKKITLSLDEKLEVSPGF